MALAAGVLASGFSKLDCPARVRHDNSECSARPRHEPACPERHSQAQSVMPLTRPSLLAQRRRDTCTALHALALGQAQLEDEAAAMLHQQSHRAVAGLWHKFSSAFDATRKVVALAVRLAQLMILTARVRLRRQQQQQRADTTRRAERSAQQPSVDSRAPVLAQLLRSLGNPDVALEAKWASLYGTVPKRSELRHRVDALYELSAQSSSSLQQALRHRERSLEDNTGRVFFKSSLTKAVMEQESALKSLVFAQVLAANSKRQAM